MLPKYNPRFFKGISKKLICKLLLIWPIIPMQCILGYTSLRIKAQETLYLETHIKKYFVARQRWWWIGNPFCGRRFSRQRQLVKIRQLRQKWAGRKYQCRLLWRFSLLHYIKRNCAKYWVAYVVRYLVWKSSWNQKGAPRLFILKNW